MHAIPNKGNKVLCVCTTDSMIWNFLVPHIRLLESLGYTVECACSRTGFYYDELVSASRLKMHEIPFERNPLRKKNIEALHELTTLIRDGNFDIVYCHEPVGGALARLAGKKNNAYIMYVAHGFHFFSGAPAKHWLLYYAAEWCLSFVTNSIVTICKEDYVRAQKLHAKNTYLIPGIGIDLHKYDLANKGIVRQQYRETFGICDKDFVIVSVGELTKRKNHLVILNAIKRIENPHVKLLLCGEGELNNDLMVAIDKLGIESQVTMLGFRRDIPNILAAGDVFVFPSLWEGLGLAGIEALYSGLPVIGSNRQGIKDYVIEGVTGYLFDPNDSIDLAAKIVKLMNSDGEVQKFVENGKKASEYYSLRNSIQAMLEIYEKEGLALK